MNASARPLRIGFIGLGIMGRSMAGHILAAGHDLHVYSRTRAKAEDLLQRGAHWCESPGEVAARSEVVITMVGLPSDVEQVYFEVRGILQSMRAGTLLVDMTTSSPALAARIAEAARAKGCGALDAPVSGGDIGARDAKLSIMVGGAQRDFDAALPVLRLMGSNIVLQGGAGAGQHTKMCNQIVIASTIVGVAEGIAYARRAGLDARTVLQSIGGGAASGFQLNVLGARMIEGDFAPGFFVEHFLKDLGIALGEASRMGLQLPGLELARSLYERLAARGGARDGTQALLKLYAD